MRVSIWMLMLSLSYVHMLLGSFRGNERQDATFAHFVFHALPLRSAEIGAQQYLSPSGVSRRRLSVARSSARPLHAVAVLGDLRRSRRCRKGCWCNFAP